jgi:hypothetical protein
MYNGEQQAFLQAGPSAPGSLPPLQQLQTQPGLPSSATIPAVTQTTTHVLHTVSQQQQQALTSGTGQPGQQDASATPFAGASLQVVTLMSRAHTIAARLKSASLNTEHSVGNKSRLWLLRHSGQQQFAINTSMSVGSYLCVCVCVCVSQHKQMSKLAAS